MIDEAVIIDYIQSTFEGVQVSNNFGYTFFFYGDDHRLGFITIANSDNEYDRVSNLDREGVYRLNIGVSRQTFQSLFGSNKIDVSSYDFTVLDTIMPHPDYAPQSYICILNPTETTFAELKPLLAEAYEIAQKR